MKIAIPGVLILVGMVGLITMGILQGAIPEIGVDALSSGEYHGQTVRLQGVIHAIDSDTRPMRFSVRDMKNPEMIITAEVDDHRPDLFKVDTDVAVVGVFDKKSQIFEGTKIYTKCPSKYEATDQMGMGSEAARRGEAYSDEPAADPVPATPSSAE